MKMLAFVAAALTLGATGAECADIYPAPYPAYPGPAVVAPAPPPPVVVAPPPYGTPYVQPYPYAGVVNPYTGRWCTIEPSGYRWCWTP